MSFICKFGSIHCKVIIIHHFSGLLFGLREDQSKKALYQYGMSVIKRSGMKFIKLNKVTNELIQNIELRRNIVASVIEIETIEKDFKSKENTEKRALDASEIHAITKKQKPS